MDVTPAQVAEEGAWVRERDRVPRLINDVRKRLGPLFDADPDPITATQYRAEVETVFADGDVAVNVAALVALLRDLHVPSDYPGFVVDEFLGRKLAAMIAGKQPMALLAEATFHFADVHIQGAAGEAAGMDDLDAALAAGFQTRLPGWEWTRGDSPFDVDR